MPPLENSSIFTTDCNQEFVIVTKATFCHVNAMAHISTVIPRPTSQGYLKKRTMPSSLAVATALPSRVLAQLFTSVPSLCFGQTPCTGHPAMHVQVAHRTSFKAAENSISSHVGISQNRSSKSCELLCKYLLSSLQSMCVTGAPWPLHTPARLKSLEESYMSMKKSWLATLTTYHLD